MLKWTFPLAFLGLLSLVACQSGGQATDKSQSSADTTGIEQFAGDKQFQDAHEIPGEAAPSDEGQMMAFPAPDGQDGRAYALMPEKASNKYLLVIHEWWGLNGHIKQEAERLFEDLEGVNVLALDLYDGQVADTREKAGELMQGVSEERARAIIQGALDQAGPDARIATIGWCFGGGWSLKAAIMAEARGEACVMYYGMPVTEAEAIEPLQAPILGIFARQDEWITPEVARSFESLARETGKTMQLQLYDADHAFANPSSPRYVQQAAREANQAALAFLQANLK